jgi:hypothetical protein
VVVRALSPACITAARGSRAKASATGASFISGPLPPALGAASPG